MDSKHSFRIFVVLACTFSVCSFREAYGADSTDPCSVLTQAQVSAMLGTTVQTPKRVAPKLCEWSAPNQPNSMNAKKVTLTISDERAFGYAKAPIISSVKTMPASGICDDAVYTVTPGVTPGLGISLYVKMGNSYFVIHVYGFPDKAKAMTMEKTLAGEACAKL